MDLDDFELGHSNLELAMTAAHESADQGWLAAVASEVHAVAGDAAAS
jgi:hypothetical protein